MDIFLTILSGISVFVIGQFVLKFIIDPILEFKKVIGEIAHFLIEYSYVYTSPGEKDEDLQKKVMTGFLKLSSQLQSHMYLIPGYRFFIYWMFGLPTLEKIIKAARGLIYLSNKIGKKREDQGLDNLIKANEIREALGIYIPEDQRLSKDQL